jgi:predicted AlkP superfamily pyrophosphatase or phosphodiesterase
MKNKKVIIAVIAVVLVIAAGVAAFFLKPGPYEKDPNDTEELYNTNVAAVGYENTIETAIPQTELYNVIIEHFNSKLPKGKTEKKAIILGYDGCRADVLATAKDSNSGINALLDEGASINLLYCGGVNYPEVNTQDTSTAPGWCSILTGQWADVHGVTGNDIPKSMDAKTLMTTLTEDGTIGSASFITKWAGHFSRKNATYLPEVDYCSAHALPVTFTKCDNDEASHQTVLAEVKDEACSDFVFVIYEPTDSTGHNEGFSFNNPAYQEAFAKQDAYAYETIQAIKARETYDTEDWLIIITSDHGGIKTGHGKASIQERMTFAVMNKEF